MTELISPRFKKQECKDYWIKELDLAGEGYSLINIAKIQMNGVSRFLNKYRDTKPLRGVNILGCVTVTKETAVLILALKELGATVRWCSDNRFSINDKVSAALVKEGVSVYGWRGMQLKEYYECMDMALQFKDIGSHGFRVQVIDDGCDITRHILNNHTHIIDKIDFITEQTTCGVNEARKIVRGNDLPFSIVNINDSFVKRKFDNYYGVSESLVASLKNTLGIQISGRRCVIYGYGSVGEGCAKALKAIGAMVYVVEVDILAALKAHMDGFSIASHQQALAAGQIFITATGCDSVISLSDMESCSDGSTFCNVGHGDNEYAHNDLVKKYRNSSRKLGPNVTITKLGSGKRIFSLCEGALVNMIAASGNSPEVMSLTFSCHLVAHVRYNIDSEVGLRSPGGLTRLTKDLDREIAKTSYADIGCALYKLSNSQKEYLGVS